METIKNVVFDLGGVLVPLDLERCIAAFRSLGMDAVAELINPCYPAEMLGRLEHGDITFHETCDEMRRLSNRPDITDEQIEWAYGEFLNPIPVKLLRQIEALRRRGIRTGLSGRGGVRRADSGYHAPATPLAPDRRRDFLSRPAADAAHRPGHRVPQPETDGK